MFGERVEKRTSPEEGEGPAETEEGDVAPLEQRLVSRDAGEGTDTVRIEILQRWRWGRRSPVSMVDQTARRRSTTDYRKSRRQSTEVIASTGRNKNQDGSICKPQLWMTLGASCGK